MNDTGELGLGSSGKIVHQGDDLRSLDLGSDGLMSAASDQNQEVRPDSDI